MFRFFFPITAMLVLMLASSKLFAKNDASFVPHAEAAIKPPLERQDDSLALVQLYHATNGPGWSTIWDLEQPMDTWSGITLNASGHVTEIELGNNLLQGTLPELDLPSLRVLDLSLNNLNGTDLVAFVTNSTLPALQEMNLNWCALVSTIPDFANYPELEVINLDRNYLSGSIPLLLQCPKITAISLAENDLTGQIPSFDHLTGLQFLNLYQNQIEGSIPSFVNATELEFLILADNRLEGCLPDFANAPNLETLIVFDNELDCPVPAYSHLSNLVELNVRQNRLTFEDLLPSFQANMTVLADNGGIDYLYAPQKNIPLPFAANNYVGFPITIDLEIDEAYSGNIYQWYKGGDFLVEIIGSNQLVIDDPQPEDAGSYYCIVTNPDLPDLSLRSDNINVSIYPLPECMDDELTVDLDPIPQGTSWVAADLLESSGVVSVGADGIRFIAGEKIRLLPGFKAPAGANLRAYILPCETPETSAALVDPTLRSTSASTPDEMNQLSVFPNPSRTQATLSFYLSEPVAVDLIMTDLNGKVSRVVDPNTPMQKGLHSLELNIQDLASGIYYVHLMTENQKLHARLVIMD